MEYSLFQLYLRHEKEVDALLDRTEIKQQIVSHIPNPVILYSPPGSGATTFAKTCLAIAGFTKPTLMDALDAVSPSYGNIQQSLYSKSNPISYIFKYGHGTEGTAPDPEINARSSPTVCLTHQPISPSDIPTSALYLAVPPLTETQFQKLFSLYTGDNSPHLPFLYQSSYGNFHGLAQAVYLYRTNIKAYYAFMEEFSSGSASTRPLSGHGPWNISNPTIENIRNLYTRRLDMPSADTMCKTWPQYISNAWRIILPRYSAFAKGGILSGMPEELKCWYIMNQFQQMPSKGIADEHELRVIPQDIKPDSMYDLVLYSAHCFGKPREELDILFRRIHNAYYNKIRSNKNKITTKTKKESIETARLDLFRETYSWNDKLFRKWTQYTAAFSGI